MSREGISYPHALGIFDACRDISYLARLQDRSGTALGEKHPYFQYFRSGRGRHKVDRVPFFQHAVHNPYMRDHAKIGVIF